MLKGVLNQINLVILGVYALNNTQLLLGENFYSHLLMEVNVEMILLGDFNAIMDTMMDRSKITSTPIQFQTYMEALRVIDVWKDKIYDRARLYLLFGMSSDTVISMGAKKK